MRRYALISLLVAAASFIACNDTRSASDVDAGDAADDISDVEQDTVRDAAPDAVPDTTADAERDTAGDADVGDATADADATDDAAGDTDSGADADAEDDVAWCAVDCPCEATCEAGVVTVWGTGGAWEGPCDEAPLCPATITLECDSGVCSAPPEDGCEAARAAEAGDLALRCADAGCGPDAIVEFVLDSDVELPDAGLETDTRIGFDVAVTDEVVVVWWLDAGTLRVARAGRDGASSLDAFTTFEIAPGVVSADHAVIDEQVQLVWAQASATGRTQVRHLDVSGAPVDPEPGLVTELLATPELAATDSANGLAVILWADGLPPSVYWPDLADREADVLGIALTDPDPRMRAAPHPAGLLVSYASQGFAGAARSVAFVDRNGVAEDVAFVDASHLDPGSEFAWNPIDGSWVMAGVSGEARLGTVDVYRLDPDAMTVSTSWTVQEDAGLVIGMAPDVAFDDGQSVVLWPDQREWGDHWAPHDVYFARLNRDGTIATPGADDWPYPDRRVWSFGGERDAHRVRFESLGDGEFFAVSSGFTTTDTRVNSLHAIVGRFDCGALVDER